jgi:DNA-directed RNA polymerase subunit beta
MNKQLFVTTLPNYSENTTNSFCWFLEHGLSAELRAFASALNFRKNLNIRIYSDEFILEKPGYPVRYCKEYDLTFSVSIYVPIELLSNNGKIVSSSVCYIGEIPLMTKEGTFVFNGCERVIINQIIRSPGVYYRRETKSKKISCSATLISDRGSWLKFEFDIKTGSVQIIFNKTTSVDFYSILEVCGLSETFKDARFNLKPLERLRVESRLEQFNGGFLKQDLFHPLQEIEKTGAISTDANILKIFNDKFYRLGKIGRQKLNTRLKLDIPEHTIGITMQDIIAISHYLGKIDAYLGELDDIDDLRNRRVRAVGELIQLQLRIGLNRVERLIRERVAKTEILDAKTLINAKPIMSAIKEFFGSSQLSQFMDQTNPIASLTHKRRITSLGPGGLNRDRISLAVRDIHPSHYGRICPIETPEGQNAGLITSLACYARLNEDGFIETPFFKIQNGVLFNDQIPIYLKSEEEELVPTAPADQIKSKNSISLESDLISIRYKNEFNIVPLNKVGLVSVSPLQNFSIATGLIPFLEHDDANRALMGSNMQRQSLPLLYPHTPIVGTGLEHQLATDSGSVILNKFPGTVTQVTSNMISVINKNGESIHYNLQKFERSNQDTCINQRPIVWPNETVTSGQVLADGPATLNGELALGQNLLVAYMPWEGFNYEDAILINERLVQENLFTSIHIGKFDIAIRQTPLGSEKITCDIPNPDASIKNLDRSGIVYQGAFVKPGDLLVGKVTPQSETDELPEARLLRAIFGEKNKNVKDSSLRVPKGHSGRVLHVRIFRSTTTHKFNDSISVIRVFIAQIRKIQVGDKIAGRHGNKGIVSRIVPRQDMPFLPNGEPVDLLLNPLGVPSRMNVGQIFECLLGLAGSKLDCRFKVMQFDERYGIETSRNLINSYLAEAADLNKESWLVNPCLPGRVNLKDGRTGIEFDNPILIGKAYMLKLIHQVDDKIHARSTGPYSLITQQPLKGRSRNGGQRFGEMEVWALQAFGCAYTLQELMTLKSDDMEGRNEVLNAIVQGLPIPKPGIPESFKVLIRELHSLGLDISFYKINKSLSRSPNETEVDLVGEFETILQNSLSI